MLVVSAMLLSALASGFASDAVQPDTAARRDDLKKSYGDVCDKLGKLYENLTPEREDELDALMNRSWSLAEQWLLSYLADHPDSAADELAADLRTLSPPSRSENDDVPGPLDAGAVSLATGSYAIAIHSGSRRSTIVIAARSAKGDYRIAWRIRTVPLDARAEEGELGRWRTSGPGWHDGPLDGKVILAPKSAGGEARFWVDAVARPDAGLICPAQISLWRWTGKTAVLEYVAMYDAPGQTHVELQGDVLRLRVNTPLACFAPCGACDGPHATWSLRLRDHGVEDLGRVDDDPELHALHELFRRVAAAKDASALAAPAAIAYVKSQFASMRDKYVRDDGEECWVGLIMGEWKVEHHAGKSVLDAHFDRLYPLSVAFETRNGRPFVTGIEEHPERE
ncbi:MAG TPA: hypothetical protein VFV19_16430 [Candidatus Polarisedimenticolaceae bacterium]|nr:hypothetical protein [Candidatus Polarisedimenticolaceae bacterium]